MNSKVINLPCYVGDTVYQIQDIWYLDDEFIWKYHYEKDIVEGVVTHIHWSVNKKKEENLSIGVTFTYPKQCRYIHASVGNRTLDIRDLSNDWFINKEKAEARLRVIKKESVE